jgi:cytosine/adenosine deaminase-related metal-dependent hydrolase
VRAPEPESQSTALVRPLTQRCGAQGGGAATGGFQATTTPAQLIGRVPKLGTLQVGAPGDVSVLELVSGQVTLLDSTGQARTGNEHLEPVLTVRNGVPFGAPYPIPFSAT